jgi:hypothetical protein
MDKAKPKINFVSQLRGKLSLPSPAPNDFSMIIVRIFCCFVLLCVAFSLLTIALTEKGHA